MKTISKLSGKISQMRMLFQEQVFSANRRKLAISLIKERLMGIPMLFNRRNGFKGDLPPDSVEDTWVSEDTRAIDTKYFQRGTAKPVEDRILGNGRVQTEYQYTVQKINGASTYTNESIHRSIFSRTEERVELFSSERRLAGLPVRAPSKRRLPTTKNISGVTANLYGTTVSADGNYYHWLVDNLSRLFLIEKFHSLDSIDQVLVQPLKYDFHWDSLAALGFDRSRIVELNQLECLQFDSLIATTPPRGRGSAIVPGWLIDRYNESLFNNASETKSIAGRQVYISRRDAPSRMFTNEDEVCQFMENRGFDVVELASLNLWEKIAVFRDADLIVSQTGAGLTNLMFSPSNVKVLELVDERFVYPSYASLAVYKGGTHHAHYFSTDSTLGLSNAIVAKSTLDIGELQKSLVRIL